MGRAIEEIALQKRHTIVARIHPTGEITTIDEKSIEDADVCIDFSHPETALNNIKMLAKLKKNIVMGTTGWYDHLDEVKQIVEKSDIGFLYSPNFSVGVLLLKKMIAFSAQLINDFDEYDISGYEMHHNQKADSPSGTTIELVSTLLKHIDRKTVPNYESVDRAIKPHELHFASLRCGSIAGTHTIIFDSPSDAVTITHQAKNRLGFATGAVKAAEWLTNKKGFYTLDEIL